MKQERDKKKKVKKDVLITGKEERNPVTLSLGKKLKK